MRRTPTFGTAEEKIEEAIKLLEKKQVNGSGIIVLSEEERLRIIELLEEVLSCSGV